MLTKIMMWVSIAVVLLTLLELPVTSEPVLVEIVVCVSGLLVVCQAVRAGQYLLATGFLSILVAFSPISPIAISGRAFLWLNWIGLAAFLIAVIVLRRNEHSLLPSIINRTGTGTIRIGRLELKRKDNHDPESDGPVRVDRTCSGLLPKPTILLGIQSSLGDAVRVMEEGAMKGFMHRFISRLTLTMLVGVALPFVFSTAMIAKDVPGKMAREIGFIELGHISRIDTKNHAVMIKEAKSGGDDGWRNYKQSTGDIGARRGRRGRWVGLITPGGVGDPTGSRRPDKTFERKVVLSPETVLKDGQATFSFEELNVGDFVQIKSVMQGKNFEAKEVQRYSKKAQLCRAGS